MRLSRLTKPAPKQDESAFEAWYLVEKTHRTHLNHGIGDSFFEQNTQLTFGYMDNSELWTVENAEYVENEQK